MPRGDDPTPEATRPPRVGAWLALGSGVALGLYGLAVLAVGDADLLAVNLEVYYHAADAALSGGDLYAASPPDHPAYRYRYPPVVAVAFLPLAALPSWETAYAAFTAVSVGAGLACAATLVGVVERHGERLSTGERALVALFVVGSVHAVPTLFYGNVNLVLAALLAAGFAALHRDREARAGAALGLVALVKVFPAALGAWLVRRRAWRAVAAAVATGGGLLVAGVPVFGVGTHREYLTAALLPRMRTEAFAGGLDPGAPYVTLRRPLSVLLPSADPWLYSVLAAAVLAPVVGYLYAGGDGPVDRLVAVHGTVSAVLVFFPSYFVYYVYLYFPLVPLLFLLEGRTARRPFVAGAVVANVAVTADAAVAAVRSPLLPAGVEAALVGVVEPLLTLATPTLWGAALMLAGCVVHRRRSGPPLRSVVGRLRARVVR